jgi:cell wall assembly regulator SMI1
MPINYNNEINNSEKCLTVDEINEFEKKYSFTFPLEIKNFYLKFNGGVLKKKIFDGCVIQLIYSIRYGEMKMEDFFDPLITDNLIPKWLIPFARDPGGDDYCFSIRKEDEGSIYLFRSEEFDPDDLEIAITYVTDSIVTFINGMEEDIIEN